MIDAGTNQSNIELIRQLKRMPSLQTFAEEDINRLLRASKVVRYQAGETILREGQCDQWLYFLVSGRLRVVKHGEAIGRISRTGDVFGEMGLIEGTAKSATIIADEPSLCLITDVSRIQQLAGENRLAFGYILYRIFAEILASRLRQTSEELSHAREHIARLQAARAKE